MKYLGGSFSVYPGGNQAYRDNYDKIFGKGEDEEVKPDMEPVPIPPAPPELQKPKTKKKKNEKNKKSKK